MNAIKKLFSSLDDDGRKETVTINLMLTERCPFECAHCFYGSSPRKPKRYMSDDVLAKVRAQVETLRSYDIPVSINLIGGEPTINLEEFERVLYEVDRWGEYPEIELQMTTNGWFLHNAKHARRFFEIIQPVINDRPGTEEGFSIRVSDDKYHQEFRPGNRPIKGALGQVFEYGSIDDEPVLWETQLMCMGCGEEFDDYPDGYTCPECGGEDIYPEEVYGTGIRLPENNPNVPWMYADNHLDINGVIPSGERGQFGNNVHDNNHVNHRCTEPTYLTYLPNGRHTDGCCRGSLMPFGSVNDNPLVLLALIQSFLSEARPNCLTCRDDAQVWKEDNLKNRKAKIKRDLKEWEETYNPDLWEGE